MSETAGQAEHEPIQFEQVVEFDSPIESVWAAVSNPADLAEWLGSTVDLDLTPGGRGVVVDDDGTTREVVVTEVRDRERLSWHWWSDGGELSSVELRLDEHDGRTRLHIIEAIVASTPATEPPDAVVGRCARRWSAATGRLWHHVSAAAFA